MPCLSVLGGEKDEEVKRTHKGKDGHPGERPDEAMGHTHCDTITEREALILATISTSLPSGLGLQRPSRRRVFGLDPRRADDAVSAPGPQLPIR